MVVGERSNDEEGMGIMSSTTAHEVAMFGAGCFWGVEVTFRNVPGVVDVAVGYAGGELLYPTYQQVCTGVTGHAEVVQVRFDPSQVSYEALLDVLFASHDPTQKDRQGPDVGRQYRSVVLYHDELQRAAAEATIRRVNASGRYPLPVATTVEPATTFWRAEEHHQRYLVKHGRATCRI